MTLKFVVTQRLHNNDVVNVLNFEEVDGFAIPTPERIAELIVTEWSTAMSLVLSDEWQMTKIEYYDSANPPGTPAIDVTPASLPLQGASTASAMPNQVSLLVNWKTVGGPPFRGRTNLGGVAANQLSNDGTWQPTALAAAAALAFNLTTLTDPNGPRAGLVIVSTNSSLVPAGTTAPVSVQNVNPIPATQRRRRLGVGS